MSEFANYSAPREDGTTLCVPPVSLWGAEANRSRSRLPTEIRWSGIELSQIREWTQKDAIRFAARPTCNSCCSDIDEDSDSSRVDPTKLWFVSGHQPELFHPGVWFKNFVLWAAAKQHHAYSLNVIIDHDVATPISVLVPALDKNRVLRTKLVVATEEISESHETNIPWELYFDRFSLDWQIFEDEISQWTATLGIEKPLVTQLSSSIRKSIDSGLPIGESIALARHECEVDAGIENLEVAFSKLAKGRGFAAFVFEILSSIEAFREIYHEARQAYRRHHKIKNSSQPIPPLSEQMVEGITWLEAPFWIYRNDDPVRRAVWVRVTDDEIVLSDLQDWQSRVEKNSSFREVHQWWKGLVDCQVSIRPRALTTTLFLRLAIGDLFLHGIGGGKYDQITDGIIEQWCDIEPPPFAVATATLHLPIVGRPENSGRSATTRDIRKRIRDWRCNPERLADPTNAKVKALLIQLESRISQRPYGSNKRDWHQAIRRIKHDLQMMLPEDEASLAVDLQVASEFERQLKIQSSREYSIAVFPDGPTQQKLKELAGMALECDDSSSLLDNAASSN